MTISPDTFAQVARSGIGATARNELIGALVGVQSNQGAAANADEVFSARQAGILRGVTFQAFQTPAAGEDLTVDVKINGVSVLTAPFVYDSTKLRRTLYSPTMITVPGGIVVFLGDQIEVVRVYTAGLGPTPIGASLVQVRIDPT